MALTLAHGTTRHPTPVLLTSTSVAHSTPPDQGPPVVSRSLAHIASRGRPAPTRSARTVTCNDRPPGIYPTTCPARRPTPPGPPVRVSRLTATSAPAPTPTSREAPPVRSPRTHGLRTITSRTTHCPRSRLSVRRPTGPSLIRPLVPRPTGQLPTHQPGPRWFSLRPPDHCISDTWSPDAWPHVSGLPRGTTPGIVSTRPVRGAIMHPTDTAPSVQKLPSYTPPT